MQAFTSCLTFLSCLFQLWIWTKAEHDLGEYCAYLGNIEKLFCTETYFLNVIRQTVLSHSEMLDRIVTLSM